MKYAVVYVGCQIVEADSSEEAEEMFHEENYAIEGEDFVYAEPCYRYPFDVIDELNAKNSNKILR